MTASTRVAANSSAVDALFIAPLPSAPRHRPIGYFNIDIAEVRTE